MLAPSKRGILAARAQGVPIAETAARLDEPEAIAAEQWHISARALRKFLSSASLGMVGRQLGLHPEDLPDIWPIPFTAAVAEPQYDSLNTRLPQRPTHG